MKSLVRFLFTCPVQHFTLFSMPPIPKATETAMDGLKVHEPGSLGLLEGSCLPAEPREILALAQWSSKETRTLSASLGGRKIYLGQGLQHQGHLGCIPVLLVGLSLKLHPLSLCFAHCLNDCCLCLSDFANLFSFCLCQQDLLHPKGAQATRSVS